MNEQRKTKVSLRYLPPSSVPGLLRRRAFRNDSKAALTVLRNPAVNKRLVESGYLVIGDQPEQFAAHIRSEIANLAKVMRVVKAE